MGAETEHWAELLPAKAVYTVSNIGGSALINFLTVFFVASFDKFQIGMLQTIPAVCSILAPPLWGAISDVLRKQRVIHITCLVSGTLLMYAILFASSSFLWTCVLVFLGNFQGNPAASLTDQVVLALTERLGAEYGKQRLYGAVGYGLGAYGAGVIVAHYGIAWAFHLNLIFLVPTLLVLQMIPPSDATDTIASPSSPSSPSFADGMRTLLKRKDVLGLLFVVFLLGLMCGTMSAFLTLNLYELSGGSAQIVGIAIFCETFSELPAFYFADTIIAKLGTVKVLAISILAYGARLTCYALMTNAWYALPFEFLHGCTFGLAWAACTKYIYDAAPPGTKGTMMGVLSAVQNGLGRGVGTLVGGYLYNTYGASFMWTVTDCGVPLALLGLYLFSCTIDETSQPVPSDDDGASIQKSPTDKDHLLA